MGWNSRLLRSSSRPGKGRRAFLRRKKAEIRRTASSLHVAELRIREFKASLDPAENARSKARPSATRAVEAASPGYRISKGLEEALVLARGGSLAEAAKIPAQVLREMAEDEWAALKAQLDGTLADDLFDDD